MVKFSSDKTWMIILVTRILETFYPAFATLKSFKRYRKEKVVHWMTYWFLYHLFFLYETEMGGFFSPDIYMQLSSYPFYFSMQEEDGLINFIKK